MPSLPVALLLRNVKVRYGPAAAEAVVSLGVRRGEIVGLIGPNGAGKSWLLAAAAGVIDPGDGTVAIDGTSLADDPSGFARRVGYVPAWESLYDRLTASDNLRFFGRLYGACDTDLDARVARGLARAGLADRGRDRVATLPAGLRQRLSLEVARLHDPPVLLLDDPTAALDAGNRDALLADLARLRDGGHAVLLATHDLGAAAGVCDRVFRLDNGRLAAAGPPAAPARAVLYGHLREDIPRFVERGVRERLPAGAELEVVGRRVRLTARTTGDLGRALAAALADGVPLGEFRTPGERCGE